MRKATPALLRKLMRAARRSQIASMGSRPRYSGAQNYDNITAATHNFSGDGFLLPLKRIAIILCSDTPFRWVSSNQKK
jgi:hypothetical protein